MTSNEPLPDLSEKSLDRIEASVFTGIADDRARRRTRRARWWAGGTAAVAVVAVAAVIGPAVVTATTPSAGDGAVIAGEAVVRTEEELGDLSSGEASDSGMADGDAATSQIVGEVEFVQA